MFIHVDSFFFKQKTAYEMRISDWSADVCSSDLPYSFPKKSERLIKLAKWIEASGKFEDVAKLLAQYRIPEMQQASTGDRKSVAQGKSASVRLDLGGRRIMKKKRDTCRRTLQHVPIKD